MNVEKLIAKYQDILILSEQSFQKRQFDILPGNTALYLYNVTDKDRCLEKIKDIFGNCQIESDAEQILVVPSKDFTKKTRYTFSDLVEIIYRLRDPDGCLWDREQTNMSIRTNAIEEAYELVEAVELDDNKKICEESGDVLLQGIFNAIIAQQENRFSVNDMLTNLCQKLVSRHTHIFGKDKAQNKEEALQFWEQAKAKEKSQKSVLDKLNDIPKTFNALLKANKVQKIIKKTGFDFATIDDAVQKIYEELKEFTEMGADKEWEGGDLLFSVVNALRMANIDPEVALMGTTNRFVRRFEYVVKKAEEMDKKVEDMSLEEMEKLYQESKKALETAKL